LDVDFRDLVVVDLYVVVVVDVLVYWHVFDDVFVVVTAVVDDE
jgi:hypothetical protein